MRVLESYSFFSFRILGTAESDVFRPRFRSRMIAPRDDQPLEIVEPPAAADDARGSVVRPLRISRRCGGKRFRVPVRYPLVDIARHIFDAMGAASYRMRPILCKPPS